MNVRVLPGLAFSRVENKILHTAYDVSAAVSAAHATMERLDTLEVRAVTQDIDAETRAFKDPATGAITYAGVNTKTKAFFEARCLPGTPGAGVAPNAETGWTKLAEVRVPAGATQIITSHIRNISAEEDAAENGTWTAQKAVTFNLGSVESIKNTLYAHTRSNVTANNTVHGIRQGSRQRTRCRQAGQYATRLGGHRLHHHATRLGGTGQGGRPCGLRRHCAQGYGGYARRPDRIQRARGGERRYGQPNYRAGRRRSGRSGGPRGNG